MAVTACYQAAPGRPDAPERVAEKAAWRREAQQGYDELLEELWENIMDGRTGAYEEPELDFTVPLHKVVEGVFTTYSGRCKCGCSCSCTEDCHCLIEWDYGTLYPRPAPQYRAGVDV